jgi:hypothetical protein
MEVILQPSDRRDKKWQVMINNKTVHFGQKGAEDLTIHKDPSRMNLYLARHSRMGEDWTKKGITTAGFWSRWLLWSKPSLEEAKKLIESKFNIKINSN